MHINETCATAIQALGGVLTHDLLQSRQRLQLPMAEAVYRWNRRLGMRHLWYWHKFRRHLLQPLPALQRSASLRTGCFRSTSTDTLSFEAMPLPVDLTLPTGKAESLDLWMNHWPE